MQIKEVKRFNSRLYREVLSLLPQLSPDIKPPSTESFKIILKSKGTHFFIAELDNGQIAGMLTICINEIPSGTKLWIEDVVVDKSERGKGFGEDLMLFAIDYARSKGVSSIELTSRPARIEANKLYLKLGFALRETNVYTYRFQ
jgi:ribosomal protein S18 acetylase RimI-like enzyme